MYDKNSISRIRDYRQEKTVKTVLRCVNEIRQNDVESFFKSFLVSFLIF
jgi:predicted transcriptional regulator